ncbi:MAG: flagellar biosynthetic protein FliQ [Pirellulaceae bacterium]|jgi:flagellar biosynthesis protein FliQ|nr:flagellar biosynthetic protein FliQ [Pirellulaceae bacterium]MDG2471300.1 flagellar biosynthetic protein FliQ [Pirellulaceae bacterium]
MIEITVNALTQLIILSLPLLLAGLVISLLIGFFQAITQIQDTTISFVPKLILMMILVVLGMPWFLQMMTEYSRHVIENAVITTTTH